jgi:hypothetical protein
MNDEGELFGVILNSPGFFIHHSSFIIALKILKALSHPGHPSIL